MYKVITRFKDLQDPKGHIYNVGDTFPCVGVNVSPERIAELAGNKNKIGKPIIEEVKENVNVDGDLSGTEKLVRQGSDEVVRKVRNRKRKSDVSRLESQDS